MQKQGIKWVWDAWCVCSIIGIWPRFVEPRLLSFNHFPLPVPHLPKTLAGLKILQFSDLHWHAQFSLSFAKKLVKRINALEPDLIVFTGDFLCRSQLVEPDGLKQLFCALKAKVGCFAILGNHDYDQFVTVNPEGEYDVEPRWMTSDIVKGFKRLFQPMRLANRTTDRAKAVKTHPSLINLLEQTPFQLLRNQTEQVSINQAKINICGLEEYTLGRFDPQKAFQNYQSRYPGIVLSHHPDTAAQLCAYPGELLLMGHTHGGQVNLPFMWKRFTRIQHLELKKGLKRVGDKWVYVSRGIGSVIPFRWFSLPEITLFTLTQERP